MPTFLITIFLGSFLLFQVQPLIGRYILPWFGGSPAVWTTCMLFFQTMLLAGYGYAHWVTTKNRRNQGYFHAGLLALALLFLPISPSPEFWKPAPEESPMGKILLLLLANIGAPYLILSATAPLLQHWFARSYPGKSPYRLYSLSNIASLLALLSYPFVFEPRLTLNQQVLFWSWGFAGFALCCGWCAIRPLFETASEPSEAAATSDVIDKLAEGEGRIPVLTLSLWFILSACGSAALLATTNQLCQEVAVVPFLWVIPLALYLVTFIVCFNSDRAYDRVLWGMLFAGALIPACRVLYLGINASLPAQILVYLATLFTCCMVCHGELVRSRPAARQLTAFYLTMSAGGAAGGAFVALVAPLLFSGFWEFPITMIAASLAIAFAWYRDGALAVAPRWLQGSIAAGVLGLVSFTVHHISLVDSGALAHSRNFYGVLRVFETSDSVGRKRYLRHGRVMHGNQYTAPERLRQPTTYYGPESGAGLALRHHPRRLEIDPSLRVGVIGLGAGTLAAYGKPGDTFRFYEINTDVIRYATTYFTYLGDSAAKIETVPGDARIVLETELKRSGPQQFDVLIVDAFSSDAIPVHLLTRECFATYKRHLNTDGILLVHITNRFLNLKPVVRAQAEHLGLRAFLVKSPAKVEKGISEADWMLITANSTFPELPDVKANLSMKGNDDAATLLWSDDFVSLWQVLKL